MINWYIEGSDLLMDPRNPDIASNEAPSMQMMLAFQSSMDELSSRVENLEKEKSETADKMKKLENENTELKAQVESRLSIRRKRNLSDNDDDEGPPARRQMRNSTNVWM